MLKINRLLAMVVLSLFLVSCGGGGGDGDGSGTQQQDISQYSAGDVEDPDFNGMGIDEGV